MIPPSPTRSLISAAVALLCLHSASADEEKNDLMPLRIKKVERTDRLPHPREGGSAMTNVRIDHGVANHQLGEAFAQAVQDQLQRLVVAKNTNEIGRLITDDFRGSSLNPSSGWHALGNGVEISKSPGSARGKSISPQQLLTELQALGKLKMKVVLIDGNQTIVNVEADREGAEYSGVWRCIWTEDTPPRLSAIMREGCKTVRSTTGNWFVDATRATIGHNPRFDAQVMHGIEYWSQRITRVGDLAMSGHHGIAVGDVNGDGLEDIYACDGGSLPNQLYLQQPDGTAKESAAEWNIAWLEDSRSALLIDLDNDGDQDLVVATIAMIAFAENTGTKFLLRGGFPGAPYPFSLSAADFDSDGDLDIYTCVYSAGDESISGRRGFEARTPFPFNDANNGGQNVLLKNLGNFKFSDATTQVGLDKNNTRWSFAAAWEDYDRDGDPDLYVANDFGRNSLYRNDGGTFTDVAATAGVEDMAAGMSVAWGDFNRDGAADLHIGNMFSAAGSRVGFQKKYTPGLQRMARGNSLFASEGDSFKDVSLDAGITHGGWAWSSALADLNNDGWQDIVVANGYLTNTRNDDL